MIKGQYSFRKISLNIFKIVIACLSAVPFYITFCFAVKTKQEIAFTGLAFPKVIHLSNFIEAIEMSNFFLALKNSLLTTIPAVFVLTLICSMAAYIIARRNTKFYNIVYYLFLGTILIPFQTLMLPIYTNLKTLHLLNTLTGYTLTRVGFLIPYSILILTGFVKTIPRELEEAASIDGAGKYSIFFRIIIPLMKPIIVTTIIINALYMWNDFQTAILVLQKAAVRTLPLTQFYFFSENSIQLNLAFALFSLSMIPILALYLIFQRSITNGIMAGAIKG